MCSPPGAAARSARSNGRVGAGGAPFGGPTTRIGICAKPSTHEDGGRSDVQELLFAAARRSRRHDSRTAVENDRGGKKTPAFLRAASAAVFFDQNGTSTTRQARFSGGLDSRGARRAENGSCRSPRRGGGRSKARIAALEGTGGARLARERTAWVGNVSGVMEGEFAIDAASSSRAAATQGPEPLRSRWGAGEGDVAAEEIRRLVFFFSCRSFRGPDTCCNTTANDSKGIAGAIFFRGRVQAQPFERRADSFRNDEGGQKLARYYLRRPRSGSRPKFSRKALRRAARVPSAGPLRRRRGDTAAAPAMLPLPGRRFLSRQTARATAATRKARALVRRRGELADGGRGRRPARLDELTNLATEGSSQRRRTDDAMICAQSDMLRGSRGRLRQKHHREGSEGVPRASRAARDRTRK